MIWQIGRVVASDRDGLTLEFPRHEACRRCARGEGCGAGVFAGLLLRSVNRVMLPPRADFTEGAWVRVGVESSHLLRAALLVYGLPLLAFLAGAAGSHALAPTSGVRDLLALAGGVLAFVVVLAGVGAAIRLSLDPVIEPLSCGQSDIISS